MTVALTSSAIVVDLFKQEAHDRLRVTVALTSSAIVIDLFKQEAHDRSAANDCCTDIECDCY